VQLKKVKKEASENYFSSIFMFVFNGIDKLPNLELQQFLFTIPGRAGLSLVGIAPTRNRPGFFLSQ